MPGAWKSFRHRLELAGVKIIAALPAILPYRSSIRASGFLGTLAFDVFHIRRRVTLENLERAFGTEMSPAERIRVGRRSYVNFAKSIGEFAAFGRLKHDDYARLVRFTGLENLKAPIAAGNGVMAVTGHFGSWELLGAGTAANGLPVDFLVGEQSNSLVNDLMNEKRRSAGIGIIERGIAARGVFESLRKGRVVALLADQNARRAGIFVDFFGTPASTFQGTAQFAYRTGCSIVFSYIIRREDETHDAVCLKPLEVRADAPMEEEIRRLTEAHVKILEKVVRMHPDHYFWAHKRWKTRPPAAAQPPSDVQPPTVA